MTARQPLGYWLKTLDALITEQFTDSLEEHGVTRLQWQLLNVLSRGPATEADLGALLAPLGWIIPSLRVSEPGEKLIKFATRIPAFMYLTDFRENGGKTIVDSTGMFHGRDVLLYEALSRSTGVHIVASTGLGPEEELGGYFLTPQTNPPTPWPAEKVPECLSAGPAVVQDCGGPRDAGIRQPGRRHAPRRWACPPA